MFVLSFCITSCEKEQKYSNNKKFFSKPIQTLKDVTLYRSSSGKVYCELFTKRIDFYGGDSAKTVFPKGVKAEFLNNDNSTKAILTANYVINYQKSSLVYLKDSLVVINYNTKDTIYCKDLFWEQTKKIVYTNNPIRRKSPSGIDFGDGLSASENFDSVVIKNPHGNQLLEEE